MSDSEALVEHNPKIRAGQISCKLTRKRKILNSVNRLKHACECTDPNCEEIDCDTMKSTVVHFNLCTQNPKRNCRVCRQLLALSRYHAKRSTECESADCPIPFCAMIKQKLKRNKQSYWGFDTVEVEDSDDCVFVSEETFDDSVEIVVPVKPSPEDYSSFVTDLDESQRYLKQLLHAHKCFIEENEGVANWPCFEAHCASTKLTLRHVYSCEIAECAQCGAAKPLLKHFTTCKNKECLLCRPIRASFCTNSNASCFNANSRLFPVQLPQNGWQQSVPSEARSEFLQHLALRYGQQFMAHIKQIEQRAFDRATDKDQYFTLTVTEIDSAISSMPQ